MKKRVKKFTASIKNIGFSSLSTILFIILWQLLTNVGILDKSIIPSPLSIFAQMVNKIGSGELLTHALLSFKRAGIGLIFALAAGIPAGFLLGGVFRKTGKILEPLMRLLEKLNPFALFPVFMMLFGIGELSKSLIIFWVCIWPIVFHTLSAIKEVEPLMIKSAKTMGATGVRLFVKVIFPATLPDIFTGIKLATQVAFYMVVSAEMIGSTAGLGRFIWVAQANYQITTLYAGTLFIAAVGVIISKILVKVESKLLVWKQSAF